MIDDFETVGGPEGQYKLHRAIDIINECRGIHVNWADWQDSEPEWEEQTSGSSVGDAAWHRKWVDNYDLVLEVLKYYERESGLDNC